MGRGAFVCVTVDGHIVHSVPTQCSRIPKELTSRKFRQSTELLSRQGFLVSALRLQAPP